MGLIADTNIFIRAERLGLADPAAGLPPNEETAISAITLSELFEGVHLASRPDRAAWRRFRVEQIAATMPIISFTAEIARVHAQLRASLIRAGRIIGAHDLIIAATAVSLGWDVVTTNAKEFRQVEGLGVREI